MVFEYTWRWYGPQDPVSLSDIRQTGATGIVHALHEIPVGEVWSANQIAERKALIESFGLTWSVVESVPVHENIKKRSGNFTELIENYNSTLRNLGSNGINTVCYNFMPILDWTRTDLEYELPEGMSALRFDPVAFAAFELFLLKLESAFERYSDKEIAAARNFEKQLSEASKQTLVKTIIAGLPGGHEGYSLESFRDQLESYASITPEVLKENLRLFLRDVIPVAEDAGVKMAIHPDDPPFSILGLPRVVSTKEDLQYILDAVDSPSNGLTFCSGSLGARSDNDLGEIATTFIDRIHFLHFRSVQLMEDGSFFEADHLEGNANLAKLMNIFISSLSLPANLQIPVRPDHGHKMLDDRHKTTNPGYSCIGRMKGLSQLRGLEKGLRFNSLT